MNTKKYPTYPENVEGDFYVEKDCCLLCGIPEHIAPELFDWKEDEYCYVKKQPSNEDELNKMIEVMGDSEVNCIRYCGKKKDIMNRVHMADDICDYHPDAKAREPYATLENEESLISKIIKKLKH